MKIPMGIEHTRVESVVKKGITDVRVMIMLLVGAVVTKNQKKFGKKTATLCAMTASELINSQTLSSVSLCINCRDCCHMHNLSNRVSAL